MLRSSKLTMVQNILYSSGLDLTKIPFSAVVKKFELEPNTVDFVGHAVALYINDDFLNRPALETVEKIKLYMDSIGRYGDSPFIYPIYGLGGINYNFIFIQVFLKVSLVWLQSMVEHSCLTLMLMRFYLILMEKQTIIYIKYRFQD